MEERVDVVQAQGSRCVGLAPAGCQDRSRTDPYLRRSHDIDTPMRAPARIPRSSTGLGPWPGPRWQEQAQPEQTDLLGGNGGESVPPIPPRVTQSGVGLNGDADGRGRGLNL